MTALPKLAAPAQRALIAAGFLSLEQLTRHTEAEVAQLHGMGPIALAKLREALKAHGLAFKSGEEKAYRNRSKPPL